jgi:hypothetical protein
MARQHGEDEVRAAHKARDNQRLVGENPSHMVLQVGNCQGGRSAELVDAGIGLSARIPAGGCPVMLHFCILA